jgi:hypothetical protein
MAVAIWDHEPTPAELLTCRLARGWKPLPTATREGDVVLGYAACLSANRPISPGLAEQTGRSSR